MGGAVAPRLVARALIGKAVADRVVLADHEIEVLAVE
jgi:hypothetical protein